MKIPPEDGSENNVSHKSLVPLAVAAAVVNSERHLWNPNTMNVISISRSNSKI